jgi:hypothetical protein
MRRPPFFTPYDTPMNDEVVLEDKFFIAGHAMNLSFRYLTPETGFLKKHPENKIEVFLPAIV